MNLNATLFAQFVVFFILALFTMKFVWPPLMKVLDERAKKIAEGLAAADRGKDELAAAEKRAQVELSQAREETQKRIADSERRAAEIVDEAKRHASDEAASIVAAARQSAEAESVRLRDHLRNDPFQRFFVTRRVSMQLFNQTTHFITWVTRKMRTR